MKPRSRSDVSSLAEVVFYLQLKEGMTLGNWKKLGKECDRCAEEGFEKARYEGEVLRAHALGVRL
jgi:hypothetical protein